MGINSIIFLIIGAISGYMIHFLFSTDLISNTSTTQVPEKKMNNFIKNDYIETKYIKKEIIVDKETLPSFVKKDFDDFGIEYTPITDKNWQLFKDNLRKEYLNYLDGLSDKNMLSQAIRTNNIGMIEYLLKNGYNINSKNSIGQTPLMEAFNHADIGTIKKLIELGSNLFEKDKNGKDMLNYALLKADNKSKVDLLLENGFSFEHATKYFFELNKSWNKKLLVENIDNIDFNAKISSSGTMNYFESLIQHQSDEKLIEEVLANQNIIIEDGYNALHATSMKLDYSASLLQKLIDKGFDVNSKMQKTKQTPLMYAVRINDIEKVEVLLKNGANINEYDSRGNSVYDYIDRYSKVEHLKEYFKSDPKKEQKIKELLELYDK